MLGGHWQAEMQHNEWTVIEKNHIVVGQLKSELLFEGSARDEDSTAPFKRLLGSWQSTFAWLNQPP